MEEVIEFGTNPDIPFTVGFAVTYLNGTPIYPKVYDRAIDTVYHDIIYNRRLYQY